MGTGSWPSLFEWVKEGEIPIKGAGGQEVKCRYVMVAQRSHSQHSCGKPPGRFKNWLEGT